MEWGEGDYGTQRHTAKPYSCLQVLVYEHALLNGFGSRKNVQFHLKHECNIVSLIPVVFQLVQKYSKVIDYFGILLFRDIQTILDVTNNLEKSKNNKKVLGNICSKISRLHFSFLDYCNLIAAAS